MVYCRESKPTTIRNKSPEYQYAQRLRVSLAKPQAACGLLLGWSMYVGCLVGVGLAWGQLVSIASAEGSDSALTGKHPLTQAQAGDLLMAELRCAACHSGLQRDARLDKLAPELTQVGERISADYLRRFLASPSSAHPGTTMPDVLVGRSASEKADIAEALTHFLVAQSGTAFLNESHPTLDLEAGRALYHTVGCVACHGPRDQPTAASQSAERVADTDAVSDSDSDSELDLENAQANFAATEISLAHVSQKYSVNSLSEFLFQPLKVRASGRMPDMKLTPVESLAIAGYLIGERPVAQPSFTPQAALVTQGKALFLELNCAACHALGGIEPAPLLGNNLRDADFSKGCISESTDASPHYQLTAAQRGAIIAGLREESKDDSDQAAVAKTLTALNCIACHNRNDFGGVHADYNPYFTTSEKNLGEDARIPPPLTLVGAKLQPLWMKKVLLDGESVRPYMDTRMPQYGAANVGHLPELFGRVDEFDGAELTIPSPENPGQREREKLLRAAGRELLGDKGLNCIACHNFNGKPSPAHKGMDLMTSFPRLQSAWFNRFVRNPGALRPRIVMPSAWADGVAAHQTILNGETEAQIEAIWYYLSLGTSAADPSGIRPFSTLLTVNDQARLYRGRSRVAGFRGIAVGLPEQLNYAFNAETGTLSAIWSGEFVRVNWSGQGSGDFNPASEPLLLAQDVSWAQLTDDQAPWPRMPVMSKELRLNPDPLYPKNQGYQFRGYFLDQNFVPTFQYRIGNIEIEDRSVATTAGAELGGRPLLSRLLRMTSPNEQTIWFRALAGEISQQSERHYRSGKLLLSIPETETRLRPLPEDSTQSELLIRLQIPHGQSSVEIQYELVSE
jgi:mono/diheme cytochrome c family protein